MGQRELSRRDETSEVESLHARKALGKGMGGSMHNIQKNSATASSK